MPIEAEELEPTKKEAPYQWRVKAIDGASNGSGWTAGTFSVSRPFAIPSWALYTLLGLGAVLLLALGYLLGRRTAYY